MKVGSKKWMAAGFIFAAALFSGLLNSYPASAETFTAAIATAGSGGVYYPYGLGVAEIWTRKVGRVDAVAQITGGIEDNIQLLSSGEIPFATLPGDAAFMAYRGWGKYSGAPRHIRTMFAMYANAYHVVARKKTGISSVDELRGKRVSVGAPQSATALMSRRVLQQALGIRWAEMKVSALSFKATIKALKNGKVDIGTWNVAPPAGALMNLTNTHDMQIISFGEDQIQRITDRWPFYTAHTLPAGLYYGQETEVLTPGVWNLFVCNAYMDTDLIYRLTKAVFENQKLLVRAHPFAQFTTPENTVRYATIPLHPGVIRYLQEIEIEVPRRLWPKGFENTLE